MTDAGEGRFGAAIGAWLLARLPVLALAVIIHWKQRHFMASLGERDLPGTYQVAAFSAGLLLCALAAPLKARAQAVALLAVNVFVSLLLFSDCIYHRQYDDFLSVAAFRFANQLWSVRDVISSLVQPDDWTYLYDLPLFLVSVALPGRWLTRSLRPIRRWAAALTMLLCGAAIAGATAIDWDQVRRMWLGDVARMNRLGPLCFHGSDIGSFIGRTAIRLTPDGPSLERARALIENRVANRPTPPPSHGKYAGRNVIIVQLESFQAWTLDKSYDGVEATPALNRLRAESLHFPHFYSQAGQGTTADADLAMNCSLYPTHKGAVYYQYAFNEFRCLPTLLHEQGYKAVAMQATEPDYWNLATVYPRVGFEKYFDKRDYPRGAYIGMALNDGAFLDASVKLLGGLPKPFYAYLVTVSSHAPWQHPLMPHVLHMGEWDNTRLGDYLNAVHFTDDRLGRFIESLRTAGLLDESILMVYGDHAGLIRTNSSLVKYLGLTDKDEWGGFEAEKNVPLFIRLPHGELSGEYPQPMGQVDLGPTLLGLLGVEPERAFLLGRDVLRGEPGPVAFPGGEALDATLWYTPSAFKGGNERCVDRATKQTQPLEKCQSLAAAGRAVLDVGWSIVERDLLPKLLPPAPLPSP